MKALNIELVFSEKFWKDFCWTRALLRALKDDLPIVVSYFRWYCYKRQGTINTTTNADDTIKIEDKQQLH